MKRKLITAGAGVFMILALAGCAAPQPPVPAPTKTSSDYEGTGLYTKEVPLPDGSTVLCVVYSSGPRGGISCDWGDLK